MGGLIPSWKQYHDPVSLVSKPIQMGPVWMEASAISGIKLADTIWYHDPPASSYLSCMAVKAARFQSKDAERIMLHELRSSLMKEGINISKESSILRIAMAVSRNINFDLERFKTDLHSDECILAFRKDLDEVSVMNIIRFPSILVQWEDGKRSLISGYRKQDELFRIGV
jgi:predicted DsbA family dithiol-disulfide isomerase